MPTSRKEQAYLLDPSSSPPSGTTLNVRRITLVDQDDDGDFSSSGYDSVDGWDIYGSFSDTIRVRLADGSVTNISGTTFYAYNGNQYFTPTDGTILENATFIRTVSSTYRDNGGVKPTDLGPTCFTSGTLIEIADGGQVPIETLNVGDAVRVVTAGRDAVQDIRWIGRRDIGRTEMERNEKLRPVRVKAGVLGKGLPRRDLLVSRQHRILVSSPITTRMFGVSEVLIPAIRLIAFPGIFIDDEVETVTYFHLLFDAHEIVISEGAPTESLYTGPEAMKVISQEARDEILTLFPELDRAEMQPPHARIVPPLHAQKRLVYRHVKNSMPVLEG
ncbi:Hint domain-containing protein [Paracoccus sediminicola]|uniref:Hint domain-containing protein n=1 Tax=Paracoccus sediminicola TaxID=3017783 RepID=UPI0022F111F8|nr:Hint domain-containing protein [Paracoccus sediminicola]WBU57306.1 Hint domain-containing protein [Paracoccus sediminicola]